VTDSQYATASDPGPARELGSSPAAKWPVSARPWGARPRRTGGSARMSAAGSTPAEQGGYPAGLARFRRPKVGTPPHLPAIEPRSGRVGRFCRAIVADHSRFKTCGNRAGRIVLRAGSPAAAVHCQIDKMVGPADRLRRARRDQNFFALPPVASLEHQPAHGPAGIIKQQIADGSQAAIAGLNIAACCIRCLG